MPHLNLKMPFGEIVIEFQDTEDLKKQLDRIDFDGVAKLVSAKIGSVIAEPKGVRQDLKDICDTDGKYIIFKKAPAKKIDKVLLAIYAYGNSATVEEIKRTTGIADPSGDYLSSGSYSEYFVSLGNRTYGLSHTSLQTVIDKILPKLREPKKT